MTFARAARNALVVVVILAVVVVVVIVVFAVVVVVIFAVVAIVVRLPFYCRLASRSFSFRLLLAHAAQPLRRLVVAAYMKRAVPIVVTGAAAVVTCFASNTA